MHDGPTLPFAERRKFLRHPIVQRCLVRLSEAHAVAPGLEDWHGIAFNVSTGGIGVALPVPLRVGALLRIEPWGLPFAPVVTARIVRCEPVEFLWFYGCELSAEMSEEQLRGW